MSKNKVQGKSDFENKFKNVCDYFYGIDKEKKITDDLDKIVAFLYTACGNVPDESKRLGDYQSNKADLKTILEDCRAINNDTLKLNLYTAFRNIAELGKNDISKEQLKKKLVNEGDTLAKDNQLTEGEFNDFIEGVGIAGMPTLNYKVIIDRMYPNGKSIDEIIKEDGITPTTTTNGATSKVLNTNE